MSKKLLAYLLVGLIWFANAAQAETISGDQGTSSGGSGTVTQVNSGACLNGTVTTTGTISLSLPVTSKAAAYTLVLANDNCHFFNYSGAAAAFTLPTPVSGIFIPIQNNGTGTLTLSPTALINGAANYGVPAGAGGILASDGTGYFFMVGGGTGTINAVSGTSGQIAVSTSTGTATISLPSTITANETFSGTVTLSGTLTGSALSTYLASPPAIGGTAAAAGSFTTLAVSGAISGAGVTSLFASPPAIGGTTPAAGAFSSLKDTGVTGSTQCLHVDTTGAVTGTGTDCGSGSGAVASVAGRTGAVTLTATDVGLAGLTDDGTKVRTTEFIDTTTGFVTELPNDGSTGTTLNKLAKLSSGTAVLASTSDIDGLIGVVVAGDGTTGSALLAVTGQASCIFDGTVTAGHYVTSSGTTAGDCHDAGATRPAGSQSIGRAKSGGAAGTYTVLLERTFMPNIAAGTGMTVSNSGGTFTISANQPVNPQTGASYPILCTDAGFIVERSNGSSMADTIPAPTGACGSGFALLIKNKNAKGGTNSVITPASGTINGASTYTVAPQTSALIYADNSGTNYGVIFGNVIDGTGLSISNGVISLATIAADTVLGNASGSTAAPGAITLPSCSAGTNAVTYNTSTHAFGCNTISGSGTVNSGTAGQVAYYAGTGTAVSGEGLSALIDSAIGSTRGAILERGSSGWAMLTPSSTSGWALTSNGTSADPSYQAVTGAATTVQSGTGITVSGSPCTTTCTVALSTPVSLANGGLGTSTFPNCELLITAASTSVVGGDCGTVSSGTWTSPAWVNTHTSLYMEVLGQGAGGMWCNTASAFADGGSGAGKSVVLGTNVVAASTGYSFSLANTGGAGGIQASSASPTAGSDASITIGGTTYTGHGGAIDTTACTTSLNRGVAGGTGLNGTFANIAGMMAYVSSSMKVSVGGSVISGLLGGVGGINNNSSTGSPTAASGFGSGGYGGLGAAANGGAGGLGAILIRLSGV